MSQVNYPYKLSIITINCNNLDGLKRTVESVVNQTWKKFEYIIIDGGSTDGSAEYIQKMQEHFNYWVSEKDEGVYDAMNKGLHIAKGAYVWFINSGDILNSNKISILDEILSKYVNSRIRCVIVGTNKPITDNKEYNYNNREVSNINLWRKTLNHQGVIYKTEMLKHIGGYSIDYKIIADWITLVKLYRKDSFEMSLASSLFVDCEKPGISSNEKVKVREKIKFSFQILLLKTKGINLNLFVGASYFLFRRTFRVIKRKIMHGNFW